MSEDRWYSASMYGPPVCRRLIRINREDRWRAAIELAIAIARGEASCRPVSMIGSGQHELYVYWPTCPLPQQPSHGWWLVPMYVYRRAQWLVDAAVRTATQPRGWCEHEDVARVLERWRRSGRWRQQVGRRHRRPTDVSFGAWYRRTFRVRRKRQKKLLHWKQAEKLARLREERRRAAA
jgi:hypothetical protein